MGLRPTQGDEKCFQVSKLLSMEAPPSPLSSRAADLPAASLERNDTARVAAEPRRGGADRQTSAQPGRAGNSFLRRSERRRCGTKPRCVIRSVAEGSAVYSGTPSGKNR